MPEIKNTFLKGKMNKSLDDRLLPEGEYRDALNVQITKADGEDVGAAHNILGNTNFTNLSLPSGDKTIGHFIDNKNDRVFWFIAGTTDKIYQVESNGTATVIAEGAYLNFDSTKYITGINLLEEQLFWTDNVNAPRVIDLNKAASDSAYYTTNGNVDKVSVVKISPYLAPSITTLTNDTNISSDYIQEKFVRFSYRFKFENNEYSQLAPFSPIAFKQQNDSLTGTDVENAYKNGRLDNFKNHANQVALSITMPSEAYSTHRIVSVEILMKEADSPAVRIVAKKDISSDIATLTHDYKSELPLSTIPEQQLLRVNENAPVKALAQEIISNRLVYGNITLNRDVPDFNFTVGVDGKVSDFSNLLQHSIKSRRTYELGIVLSDKYGRKSPVITLPDSSVYVNPKVNFDVDTWNGDCLTLTFTSLPSDWGDWYSYRIVVKQPEQEYYNVYVPGGGEYNGKTYISLLGDNVNKVPRNTDNVYEGDFARSDVRLYPKVINKSTYAAVFPPFTITNGEIESIAYSIKNSSSAPYGDAFFTNYTSAEIQKFNGDDFTQVSLTGYIDLAVDPAFTSCGSDGEFYCNTPDSVYVFVNGKFKNSNDYTFVGNAGVNNAGRLTFDEMPAASDKIDVILKFNDFSINGTGGGQTTIVINALITPTVVVGGSVTAGAATNVSLSVADSNPFSENYTLTNASQIQSDAGYISVSRIGTLSQFSELPLDEIPDSDEVGFYKENPSNLIAELNDTTNIVGLKQKAVDLAVFETEPFESALDIYYETSTSGLLSEITQNAAIKINYFNTFVVKGDQTGTDNWYIEESRLYGDFNKDSVDYGVIAHITDENYKQTNLENSLIYSGIFNSRTNFNALNEYPSNQNIIKAVDIQYGSIQKLFAEDTNLNIFQEERVSSALIDKDAIYTAEGGTITSSGMAVIGQIIPYGTNYGIGKNPESFAYKAGRKYFVDKPKRAVLRLSRDGITEISNYSMRSYFRDLLSESSDFTQGMYDEHNNEYILTHNTTTIGFDESVNGWTSRYSFLPVAGFSLNSQFFTIKDNNIWKHYTGSTYNNFYSSNYNSEIELILNTAVSSNKVFQTISYEGTIGWEVQDIITDTDKALNISEYNNSYIDNDLSFYISTFKRQSGKYTATLSNVSNTQPSYSFDNEVIFGEEISGIKGFFTKLTIKTSDTVYRELFAVSSNYNINTY